MLSEKYLVVVLLVDLLVILFALVLVCNGKAAWKGRVREVMRSSQLGCRANETN